jgi:hypothetical protein
MSGLASGLALAVRSAGSADAPRARVGPEDAFCRAVRAERLEGIFGCPCRWRGRPGQCAAFRPVTLTFSGAGAPGARVTAWSCCWRARHPPGEVRRDRRRPVTGEPCAAVGAPRGLPAGRARAKLPPRGGASPDERQPPTAGHSGRITHPRCPRCARPSLAAHVPGREAPARRRYALETVGKVS